MPQAGFESTIPANKPLQTDTSDRTFTRIGWGRKLFAVDNSISVGFIVIRLIVIYGEQHSDSPNLKAKNSNSCTIEDVMNMI
jgi:hypothetical protein